MALVVFVVVVALVLFELIVEFYRSKLKSSKMLLSEGG